MHVEQAVGLLIGLVDQLAQGVALGKPTPRALKDIFDKHAESQGGSVRLACAFLVAYSLTDETWDFESVPTGIRGRYGDKKLATELTFRHVTLHNNVTAFGENLGWKGNVREFNLLSDPRFANFLRSVKDLDKGQRESLLRHIAFRFYESRIVPKALPTLPSTYLTYARSLALCEALLAIHSEGHIQQFLVASFLEVDRRRVGNRVVTHHPHASDKFDGTSGDIEEFRDYDLVASYEVTVRDDWKNRLTDFTSKVSDAKLQKYVILASNVRDDHDLCPASNLVNFVKRLNFDLAVVDLQDFFSVFCAELQRTEIEHVINRTYELLLDPQLSGRADFIAKYRAATDAWLES